MNTQSTPVHVKLWHRDFWYLAFANMFLAMSAYMLIPILPLWLLKYCTPSEMALCMGAFGAGTFLLGGFTSWLVQQYRRNRVCMVSVFVLLVCLAVLYYTEHTLRIQGSVRNIFPVVLVLRIISGAMFGLSQMVLLSTLVIDTCESFRRTEANHSATWFCRFSLPLGPIVSLTVYPYYGLDGVLLISMACCLLSIILIRLVSFPFKAPEDHLKFFSLDRYFLPQSKWLFVNLVLITFTVGLIVSMQHDEMFYAMMMTGFFLALLSQRFVFVHAELKSEVVASLLLIGAALLMMLSGMGASLHYLSPLFIGLGIGISCSRFLLFFIKLSHHCQRGTSQSTYLIAWEVGLSLGLFTGFAFFYGNHRAIVFIALGATFLSLLQYLFFSHSWYLKNKNR